MGKTISFTSTPDYLGVLTRSAFAGLAQTKKAHQLMGYNNYLINYLMMSATVPAPTVRPPSRMENFVPFSIAIG